MKPVINEVAIGKIGKIPAFTIVPSTKTHYHSVISTIIHHVSSNGHWYNQAVTSLIRYVSTHVVEHLCFITRISGFTQVTQRATVWC